MLVFECALHAALEIVKLTFYFFFDGLINPVFLFGKMLLVVMINVVHNMLVHMNQLLIEVLWT